MEVAREWTAHLVVVTPAPNRLATGVSEARLEPMKGRERGPWRGLRSATEEVEAEIRNALEIRVRGDQSPTMLQRRRGNQRAPN